MGLSRISLIVFGLVQLSIAVRFVPRTEYGAFVILQVALTFLVEFSSCGLSLTIPQSIASCGDAHHKRRLINTAVLFRLLTAMASGLLMLAARVILISVHGPSIWSALLLYLPLLLALTALEATLGSVLQGLFRFRLIATNGIIGVLANLAMTFLFVFHLRWGVLGLIYAKVLSTTIQCLYQGLLSGISFRMEFDAAALKKMLLFGFPLQLQFVLDFVYSRLDTLIITSLLGTAGTAIYEVARKIPDSVMQLFGAYKSVYFPMAAEAHAQETKAGAQKMMETSLRVLSAIALLGALISVLFGKEIFQILFSAQYVQSVPLFNLLMVALSLNILENLLGYTLVAIGESDKPLYVNLVRGVVSVVGNLGAIPLLGMLGAPLVNLTSNVMAIPMDIHFLARKGYAVRIREYLKPALTFLVGAIAFYALHGPHVVVRLALLALFVIAAFWTSMITKEDIRSILAELRSIRSRRPLKGGEDEEVH